jgi:haloalkane dehalogenase
LEVDLGHGGRLHVVDDGSGPPVLFVHGNPTSSGLHAKVIERLRDERRCVAPDLPGFGASAAPSGYGFAPVEAAAVLERLVVAELDLSDVTLVCQDWGGPLGFAVAGRHPDRFSGFVFGSTWAWPLGKRGAGTWSRFFSGPLGGRLMQQLGRRYGGSVATLQAVQGLARGVSGADAFLAEVDDGLERLRGKRAAILWAGRDPLFGEGELARWRAVFPDAEVTRLPKAGHFLQDDDPDAVAAAIRSLS